MNDSNDTEFNEPYLIDSLSFVLFSTQVGKVASWMANSSYRSHPKSQKEKGDRVRPRLISKTCKDSRSTKGNTGNKDQEDADEIPHGDFYVRSWTHPFFIGGTEKVMRDGPILFEVMVRIVHKALINLIVFGVFIADGLDRGVVKAVNH